MFVPLNAKVVEDLGRLERLVLRIELDAQFTRYVLAVRAQHEEESLYIVESMRGGVLNTRMVDEIDIAALENGSHIGLIV